MEDDVVHQLRDKENKMQEIMVEKERHLVSLMEERERDGGQMVEVNRRR